MQQPDPVQAKMTALVQAQFGSQVLALCEVNARLAVALEELASVKAMLATRNEQDQKAGTDV